MNIIKIIVVGDHGTGKSTLVSSYAKEQNSNTIFNTNSSMF